MARVFNTTGEKRPLCESVELARSFVARLRGLVGRSRWGNWDGLWIEPCTGVHTLGMRFPIDVALLDEGNRVLLVQTLSPWRIGKIHFDARSALELPAGSLERSGTKVGDLLLLEEENQPPRRDVGSDDSRS